MQCPICNENMRTIDRRGILMDTCQRCGGVWLEPREASKVVELLATPDYRHEQSARRPYDSDDDYRRREQYPRQDKEHDSDDHYHGEGKHHKRGGIRGLFDLFD
jgi:Zn-finger nucleic acid-binding protein